MQKLTLVERLILTNQFRILAHLEGDDYYSNKAEIAERGYEGLYDDLFSFMHESVSEDICNETFEILTMFRVITNSIARLTPEEKSDIELNKLEFKGFDANNDQHYGFMMFLHENENRYKELKGLPLNSHTEITISSYRSMLIVYKTIDNRSGHLTFNQLKELSNAANY